MMGLLQIQHGVQTGRGGLLSKHSPLTRTTTLLPDRSALIARIKSCLKNTPVVIVPGLRNSDERHWQSAWQNILPGSQRIEVADWHIADLDKWRNAIIKTLNSFQQPAILIAHSFGSLASASIADDFASQVKGALLVAPAAPQKFGIEDKLPQTKIARPLRIIGSDSDPWLGGQQAEQLAKNWGADFYISKGQGHINSESKLGIWTEGLKQLECLINFMPKSCN